MKKYNFELRVENIKRKDKVYLKELQIFFDKVDNVKDEELKKQILYQMHRCEERIIQICQRSIDIM